MLGGGLHRVWPGTASATLIVINYHRLWPAPGSRTTRFDDGVFGPDASVFRRQLEWLKHSTHVLDEQGLVDLAQKTDHPKGVIFSAVTFDDAYIDCYSIARPILDDLGIHALFFVPVSMIDSRRLGWWDLAAYLLKHTSLESIQLQDRAFRPRADFQGALRQVLRMFKLKPADQTGRLLEELASACGVALPDHDLQSSELMTWGQIRTLRAGGHGIASHSLSHRVLATLSSQEQAAEIRNSKHELAAHLGADVRSFAYPVGGPEHYNNTSVALAREAGYEQAFTFNTGMESLPLTDRFRISRESADSLDLLQAKVLMPSLMGIRQKRTG